MELLFFFGIVICFFLALLTFSQKRASGNTLFGIWQVVLVVHFFLLYVRHTELIVRFPHLLGLDIPLVVIHLPFIFFYVNSLVGKPLRGKFYALHLVPFAGLCLVMIVSFLPLPGEEKLALLSPEPTGNKVYSIADLLVLAQCLIYLPRSFKLVREFSTSIKSTYSNVDRINLKWLELILIGASVSFGVSLLFYLIYYFSDFDDLQILNQLIVVVFCGFQVVLAFYGIRHTNFFNPLVEATPKEKYSKSGLDDAEAKQHFDKLQLLMQRDRPFLNPDLTLSELATLCHLPANHLSQVINQFTDSNFYTYVNRYRVEEAAKQFCDPSKNQYSILGIAYNAGFNSKSVFNALFKEVMGMTPSQYRKGPGEKS